MVFPAFLRLCVRVMKCLQQPTWQYGMRNMALSIDILKRDFKTLLLAQH